MRLLLINYILLLINTLVSSATLIACISFIFKKEYTSGIRLMVVLYSICILFYLIVAFLAIRFNTG
jgi:hypothetical protein